MSVWERYSKEQQKKYILFLQVYGALSNLFRQKHGDMIPYLDSKFQETVFAKVFGGENVDIGNTPHDILSVFGQERIGIGLKTWMNSKPSYQKVMQIKSYRDEIERWTEDDFKEELALKISQIKNDRMKRDYARLNLSEDKNIYHYVTRDKGYFLISECAYPLIEIGRLRKFKLTSSAFTWSDGRKDYKYTFADSQIWQKFDPNKQDTILLEQFKVAILDDPFEFLLKAYLDIIEEFKITEDGKVVEAYLPLYSYREKEVKAKSGLNAWNGDSKNKGSGRPRPLNEIYIPIPREFHKKHPSFFTKNIFQSEKGKSKVRFHLQLPNGKRIPALVTGDGMKHLQSGSTVERDENGKKYGQSALGQWLLVDVLGLREREPVTMKWLEQRGTDSVRLWRKQGDYSTICIDFAPVGSFEAFMNDENIPDESS